jgi:hypothetical protein
MTLNPSSLLDDVSLAATPHLASTFTVGVDIGQMHDPTAVAIVRRIEDANGRAQYQIGHLERLPLRTSYPAQVAHVEHLMRRLRGPSELVLDLTGVGRAVGDLFAVRGLAPIGVTITAGDATTSEGLNYHVPKLNLVSRLQALLHNDQLKIHKGLADAQALVAELQEFRAQVGESGYWKFGARSGKHDDLVLAVAIALWRAHGDTAFAGWGCYEYYRQTYGNGGVDRELTALPPPLAPIEPIKPPQHGFGFGNQATAPDLVTLRAPAAVSMLNGLSGRAYRPNAAGHFTVAKEDAAPLVCAGWQRVV